MEKADQAKIALDEIRQEIIMEDIKDLPVRLTPKDIYQFYNRDNHIIGWHTVYKLSRKLGHRFRKGGRLYINKTDFIKFIYENDLS